MPKPLQKKIPPQTLVAFHPFPGIAGRIEKLAVNLFDLDRVQPTIRELMLGGKLDTSQAIQMDKDRMDEAGVVFSCDLLTAACICDTIRSHDRVAGLYPTRVYVCKRSWSKVPGTVALAKVEDQVLKLNPEVFTEEQVKIEAPRIAPTRVEL